MIILYSLDCPKCIVLEKKLKAKGIEFEVQKDEELIMEVANRAGLMTLPLLLVDSKVMDFNEAVKWVNNYEG